MGKFQLYFDSFDGVGFNDYKITYIDIECNNWKQCVMLSKKQDASSPIMLRKESFVTFYLFYNAAEKDAEVQAFLQSKEIGITFEIEYANLYGVVTKHTSILRIDNTKCYRKYNTRLGQRISTQSQGKF